MKIEVRLNQTERPGRFWDGWQPGDTLSEPFTFEGTATDAENACEYAFYLFNAPEEFLSASDTRIARKYRDGGRRSLSIDDVVTVDGVSYACQSMGWQKIEEPLS